MSADAILVNSGAAFVAIGLILLSASVFVPKRSVEATQVTAPDIQGPFPKEIIVNSDSDAGEPPYVIVAKIEWTDKPLTREAMQECGISWKEGSATEMERWCFDREFKTFEDAEAFMTEARKSFAAEIPDNISSWGISIQGLAEYKASKDTSK